MTSATPDGQKARSLNTQTALMEAAEKLVAKKGLENVSIKDIVRESDQKNESALQYHFKNLQGLFLAIHEKRSEQVHAKRAELLSDLLDQPAPPDIADICRLMVMPTFLLAQKDVKFRRYIAGFSQEVSAAHKSAFDVVSRSGGGGHSGKQTADLLRQALPHLDEQAFRQRLDFAFRLAAVSMAYQAKQKSAFRGPKADLFVSNLMDALEGLLTAPESATTMRLRRAD